ncbi:MAG TPA: UDP-N-acetylmuramoyl-L-alanine--D-glutamate ligase [Steroidobacteraceae bacterium]|nr:UDP-N-acetylmuramoyl-L-alanine--D-glutamate ligase [Steroidobacteraceae bacterium]
MHSVVVGLGKTGASCLRYLSKRGMPVSATDTRRTPPGLAELGDLAGKLDLRLGGFDLSLLDGASQVLMSPGVSLDEPIARAARERGIEVLGDVEVFARNAHAPVIGITGTNGKSTVTSLVARMAAAAGRTVLAGGNLGDPVLDLLEQPVPDLYVLELSSYQLETTSSLRLQAAVVLNVTPDHMDRYPTLEAYARAKARIFAWAATVVLNADDPLVAAMRGAANRRAPPRGAADRGDATHTVTFSIEHPDADYSLLRIGAQTLLARRGEALLDISRLKISGLHNAANALAALALGEAAGLPMNAMLGALESFPGLPHRSQWIADVAGVRYIDDSKGTNVGATIAAVAGMPGPLVLIAGGEGKGQDFTPLAPAFRGKVRHAVLIGRDAPSLAAALEGVCATEIVDSMQEAVIAATRVARPAGDTVLLSPACASFDMFRDYGHRGDVFAAAVRALEGAPA